MPLRDDLISAVRYAFMMRRQRQARQTECEAYGRAPGVDVRGDRYDPRPVQRQGRPTRFASGMDFDLT